MSEDTLKALFSIIPEGMFESPEDLLELINEEGVGALFPLIPEGMFESEEEFVSTFQGEKKKDSAGDSPIQPTESPIPATPGAASADPSSSGLTSGLISQPLANPLVSPENRLSPDKELYKPTDPVGTRYGANIDKGEKNTWLEEMLGKNEITDFFGDLWRAGAQGMRQGATIDDARRLFVQGSTTSEEDVAEYIRAVKHMDDVGMSDEMRDFNRIYEDNGGGLMGFVLGLGKNPTVIGQLFVSSIASMINPDVVGIGVAGAAAGAGAGAAVGSTGFAAGPLGVLTTAGGAISGGLSGGILGASAALETGLGFTEFMKEEIEKKGLAFDEKGVRAILNDPGALQAIRNKAAARGMVIGTVDAFTRGLASQMAKPVKQLKKLGKEVPKKLAARQGLKAVGIEAVGGAGGEAAARGVTGQEMDVAEIGFEGITGQASSVLTVPQAITGNSLTDIAALTVGKGRSIFKPPKYGILTKDGKNQKQSKAQIEAMLETMTDQEIIDTQFEIKNDPDLQAKIDEKKQRAKAEQETPDNLIGDDREKYIELILERDNMQDPDTPENQERLKKIKEELSLLAEEAEGTLIEEATLEDADGNKFKEQFGISIREAVEALKREGVENPTDKQVKAKQKEMLKLAIEAAKAAAKAGDRLSSTKGLIEDEEELRKLAVDELASEGIVNPTEQQINDKIDARKKSSPVEEVSEDKTRGTEEVAPGVPSELQPTTKKGDPKAKGEESAQAQAEIDSPLTPEDLAENETIVETETNAKGTIFTRLKQVTEKDGVKITKFLFNRSDKDGSQRRATGVAEEAALQDTNLEISAEDKAIHEVDADGKSVLEEGETVEYKIREIRQLENGTSVADITVVTKDKNGKMVNTVRADSVSLVEKTEVTPPSKPSKPFKNVLAPIEKPHIVPGVKGRPGITEIKLTEDGKVKSIVKRGTKNTPASQIQQNKAADFYLESMADVNAGDRATIPADVTGPNDINSVIAEESNNVREVAEAIDSQEKVIADEADAKGEVTEAGVGGLANPNGTTNIKFTPESFMRVVGRSWKEMGVSRIWIASKEKGGQNIEDGAYTKGLVDETVETDAVVDFVLSNPTKADIQQNFGASIDSTNILESLKQKFKDLTGLEATPRNIRTVLKIDPNRPPNEYFAEMGLEMNREAAGKPGVFSKKKRGPSAKKIIGAPKDKKVVVNERTALKDQIKRAAKAARDSAKNYKKSMKTIATAIKSLGKKVGKVGQRQVAAITSRFASVNINNQKSVDSFLKFVDNVFTKADFVEKISRAKRLGKKAKKNVGGAKTGVTRADLKVALETLFSIDPFLIPPESLDAYLELAEEFSAGRRSILNPPDVTMSKAMKILDAIEKNTNEEIEAGPIEKTPKDYDVDAEIKEIKSIKITDEEINNIPDKRTRENARSLRSLTAEDIKALGKKRKDGTMNYSRIEDLKSVMLNLKNGWLGKVGLDILTAVNQNRSKNQMRPITKKVSMPGIVRNLKSFYTTSKNLLTKRGFFTERIRSLSTFFIDDVFGNFNSKTIYNNTFGKLARAYETFKSKVAKVRALVDAADKLLEFDGLSKARKLARVGISRNALVKKKYKIRMYQFQREHESNMVDGKPNAKAPSAMAIAKATLKAIRSEGVLSEQDAIFLEELIAEFEVDGEISLQKIEDSFSSAEQKALDLYDQANGSLAAEAVYISANLHGNKINLLNNYTHHAVLQDKTGENNSLNDKLGKFMQLVNTKSGTIVERQNGARAMSFDPSWSAIRGAQETFLDYEMTQVMREVNGTLKLLLEEAIEGGNRAEILAVRAIQSALKEINEVIFKNSFTDYSKLNIMNTRLMRLGYQAALGSIVRSVAEIVGNLGVMAKNPKIALRGFKEFGGLVLNPKNVNDMVDFMTFVNSSQTSKLFDTDALSSKHSQMADFGGTSSKSGSAVGRMENVFGQLLKFTGLKQTASAVDKIQSGLITSPDQVMSRPIWAGTWATTFEAAVKKEFGETVKITPAEMRKMSEGKSKFNASKYAKARDAATIKADSNSVTLATSNNEYDAIIKNMRRLDDHMLMSIYRMANSYMARFSLYEYGSARYALRALVKRGEMPKGEAAALLAGITFRMTAYMVTYSMLTSLLDDELWDADDYKEDDLEDVIARQLIGSMLTLLTRGSMGNIPNIPMALSIEALLNEPHLGELRDFQKYDPYQHAMVFSLLSKEDLTKGNPEELMLEIFSGPYGPAVKSLVRALELTQKTQSGKRETRKKAEEELLERMTIELMGNLGLLPFYKDIRRVILKKRFAKPASQFTKEQREYMEENGEYLEEAGYLEDDGYLEDSGYLEEGSDYLE